VLGWTLAWDCFATDLEARNNFVLSCAGCHQVDGTGSSNGAVPPFPGNLGYFLNSTAGRAYLVQVPGSSQSLLTDRELAQVLNWMLIDFSRRQLPAPFRPYTETEVRQLRSQRLDDVIAARADIVRKLHEDGFQAR
jgi:hypothetical protein